MAQDIRELFKNERLSGEKMQKNHQERFLEKLDVALPETKSSKYNWMYVAASTIVLLGLSLAVYTYLNTTANVESPKISNVQTVNMKTLGDISPGLKKVEDYYLASINLELSKIDYTSQTKELFDGYLLQLGELDKEYQKLSLELTESGASELTVNALIDNLKFRLSLLYRLKSQLKEFNVQSLPSENTLKSI